MSTTTELRLFTVALIGNPNTGKSTLFSALAGVRQRVGNYPGVTVEKKIGHLTEGNHRYELVDLPGTYSLVPRSPDEMVAVDVLLGRRRGEDLPDAVVCIVDASNLERNLYLVSQVLELGLPTVVALNMTDVAENQGLKLDIARLSQNLGLSVIPLQANRKRGLDELKNALRQAVSTGGSEPESPFPEAFKQEVTRLQKSLQSLTSDSEKPLPRFLVERLILDGDGYLQHQLIPDGNPLVDELHATRDRLREANLAPPAIEAISRYGWVSQVTQGVVTRPAARPETVSDKIDRVLTHKVVGTTIFALMMAAVFISIFMLASTPMDWIDQGIGMVQEWAAAQMPEGALNSLITDGIIGGVGSVVIFLPQIMILFFFIALLEDCGYMARAAYLMDRLMAGVGLSGKSFIPLLSSFACAIPGIMAARVIENRRDRLTTILVAPLMSCSARLPVYFILTAAFIPTTTALGAFLPGLTIFAMYVLGILTAVAVAFVLKRTLLRGETPPFVMELPSYKMPSISMVLYRMCERGWAFLKRAGTLIFAVSVIIWAMAYYPRSPEVEAKYEPQIAALGEQIENLPEDSPERETLTEQQLNLAHSMESEQLRNSILGQAGQVIEPLVRPLGWDWRIGCAAVASFPAREVVMSVLGVIYNLGSDLDIGDEEGQQSLRDKLQDATWDETGEPVYSIPVALSIMVFFALCAQCAATLATIGRETNTWRWPIFAFVYMTTLAYLGALITFQVGRLIIVG